MFPIRRAATLKVARAAGTNTAARSLTSLALLSRGATRSEGLAPSWRIAIASLREIPQSHFLIYPPASRSYATREEESALNTAEGVQEEAEGTIENIRENATEQIEAVQEEAVDVISNVKRHASGSAASGEVESSRHARGDAFSAPKNKKVYISNLTFELDEKKLKQGLEDALGFEVPNVKLIYDGRGLSKGFGFIDFADVATATLVVETMNGQELDGRNITVQYARHSVERRPRARTQPAPRNPPSRTLFIGNLAYEMTDKDLNELFRSINNVLEVRVSVDRRTSQPRGFAHADFKDVESAETAAEMLRGQEYYGRTLRIDFAAAAQNAAPRGAAPEPEAPAGGDSVPPPSS